MQKLIAALSNPLQLFPLFVLALCISLFLILTLLLPSDCTMEMTMIYGSDFQILLHGSTTPVGVGFRPSAVEANQTSHPASELLRAEGIYQEGYEDRLEVNDQHVLLKAVTGSDEGSYTITDANGKVSKKICLNVKGEKRKNGNPCILYYLLERI